MHLSKQQNSSVALALLLVALIWQINGLYMEAFARISLPLFWLTDFIQWTVLPVVLLVFLAKKASILPKNYGFDTSTLRWQSPIFGTLAVFITGYLSFIWATYLAWQVFGQPTGFFSLTSVFPKGYWGIITWLYSSFSAGFVESIFFIGLPWLLYHNTQNTPS